MKIDGFQTHQLRLDCSFCLLDENLEFLNRFTDLWKFCTNAMHTGGFCIKQYVILTLFIWSWKLTLFKDI